MKTVSVLLLLVFSSFIAMSQPPSPRHRAHHPPRPHMHHMNHHMHGYRHGHAYHRHYHGHHAYHHHGHPHGRHKA